MSASSTRTSISILMLHGFSQSGKLFQIKSRPLVQELTGKLARFYQVAEKDVNFVFPDGPIRLNSGVVAGRWMDDSPSAKSSDLFAWSKEPDVYGTVQYPGLDQSLSMLFRLSRDHGPFTGVIGFSSGATLASMFVSWCESDHIPGRREALRTMCESCVGHELKGILETPPQAPLDFAILCAGFPGPAQYYRGFYEPELSTATVHVVGDLDSMVPPTKSMELINRCRDPMFIKHKGTHHLPRDRVTINRIVASIHVLLASQMDRARSMERTECAVVDELRYQQGDNCFQLFKQMSATTLPKSESSSDSEKGSDRLDDAASSVASACDSTGSSRSRRSYRRQIARRYQVIRTR
ncbi:Dihydrofolate [Cyphellophora attinorum]|uniref:Dihydrofolate n=1 Tax=Cyphellophora attinorum TaxID=1664694 RepID=A0A0N1NW38_9EURO|nr:Dihydrofolate [Phialophora attinorum]KPI34583.1 Dihydrofolate [Phialophora attinorum]